MSDPISPLSGIAREALAAARARTATDRADTGGAGRGAQKPDVDPIGEAFESRTRAILDRAAGGPGSSRAAETNAPAPLLDTVAKALEEVNEPLRAAERLPVDVLQGRVTSAAEIAATIKRADLTLKYSLEIRNRLVEAYREVMRMGV